MTLPTTAAPDRVLIECPQCHTGFRVLPKFLGRTAGCTRCGHRFAAQPVGDSSSDAVAAAGKVAGAAAGTVPGIPAVPAGPAAVGGPAGSSPVPGSGPAPRGRADPRLGTKLGNFRLLSVLGRGGMGTVYEAEDEHLGRRVAVKVLPEEKVNSTPEALERFLREARAACRLEHANIVTIYQVGEDNGTHYIAMQLVRGGSAADFLREHGPMTPADAVRVTLEAAKALSAAHNAGVVHRDIKPANIMLGPSWAIKVADFGLAKLDGSDLTSPGGVMGTPSYLAPEGCRGEPTDARSDIYALAATLFCLLTGRPPYQAENTPALLFKQIYEPIPDPRQIRPGIPDDLVTVLQRALAKDAGQRYQTADQLIADLEAADLTVSGVPIDPAAGAVVTDWAAITADGQGELSSQNLGGDLAKLTAATERMAPPLTRSNTLLAEVPPAGPGLPVAGPIAGMPMPIPGMPISGTGGPSQTLPGRTVTAAGLRPASGVASPAAAAAAGGLKTWHLAAAGAAPVAGVVAALLFWALRSPDPPPPVKPPEPKPVAKLPAVPTPPPVPDPPEPPPPEPLVGEEYRNHPLQAVYERLASAAAEASIGAEESPERKRAVKALGEFAETHRNSDDKVARNLAAQAEELRRNILSSLKAAVGVGTEEPGGRPREPWRRHADAEGFLPVGRGGVLPLIPTGGWAALGDLFTADNRGRRETARLFTFFGLPAHPYEVRFKLYWSAADTQTEGGLAYGVRLGQSRSGFQVQLTPERRTWRPTAKPDFPLNSSVEIPLKQWIEVRLQVAADRHVVSVRPEGADDRAWKDVFYGEPRGESAAGGFNFFVSGGRMSVKDIRVKTEDWREVFRGRVK
jgi:predicted Zn finger-like uncharacterized protein